VRAKEWNKNLLPRAGGRERESFGFVRERNSVETLKVHIENAQFGSAKSTSIFVKMFRAEFFWGQCSLK